MTVLAQYPAKIVLSPKIHDVQVEHRLDTDRGYCRVSSVYISIRAFPRDKYEYIRDFYPLEADGKIFLNSVSAMITSSDMPQKVTFGYEIGDNIKIEGRFYKLVQAANNNLEAVEVKEDANA